MNMKFCFNCGNKLPIDSYFCPKCGAEVKTDFSTRGTKSDEEFKYSNKQCIYCYQKIPKGLKYCPNCSPKFTINENKKISNNSIYSFTSPTKIINSIKYHSSNIEERIKKINLEKIGKNNLIAISAGIVVALIGGYIWSLISIGTGYEIGYMATGLGILCGYVVHLASGKKKGTPFVQIALVSSIFGIVMGKFFMAHYYLHEAIIEKYGSYYASLIPTYSWLYIKYSFITIPDLFSGYDILWGGLACLGVARIFRKGKSD